MADELGPSAHPTSMSDLPTPPAEPDPRWTPAIATVSLGTAEFHTLPAKIEAAAQNGQRGLELFHDDLAQFAKSLRASSGSQAAARTDRDFEIDAAHAIRELCEQKGLQVLALQPFRQFEGLLNAVEHANRIEELKHWTNLCLILGEDLFILIPSSFLDASQITGDRDRLVSDLAEAADVVFPVRIAYEALAWGTYINTWEDSWEIVKRANRPNLGICLDTFNIAARIWADPTSPTGRLQAHADTDLTESMHRLVREVDPDRVWMVQLADGERVDPQAPFLQVPGMPKLLSWSRNARLFPCEEERGGYLPIRQVTDACLSRLGYTGWVSMEVFSRSTMEAQPSVPNDHAARAARSWRRMLQQLDSEK
ncbi:3-dehydroshikimate dehydratase [Penicillium diatomitis]|uniref:3-dehydroshikimate dehydratase n=1 Tax=Penicillium diatomitis TaxID=2819901 RepID=A0A9W9XEB2_9EURO|nr:3-dehydroshikimate dehydratase [Penicillium diatomitis]KAJ5489771.1 3-dehydroshikimate dehydratase [Penicillium diatomitis]